MRLWKFNVSNTKYVRLRAARTFDYKISSDSYEIACCFREKQEDGKFGSLYKKPNDVVLVNPSDAHPSWKTMDPSTNQMIDCSTWSDGCITMTQENQIEVPYSSVSGGYVEMHVSAPKSIYIMAYGDGMYPTVVSNVVEDAKEKEIRGTDSAYDTFKRMNGLYYPGASYIHHYARTLTLYNEAQTTDDTLKNSIVHVVGIANSGLMKNQKLMEYYVQMDADAEYYPKANGTLDVSLYSDFGLENQTDYKDYRWEVSLIGNTEFFIDEKQ